MDTDNRFALIEWMFQGCDVSRVEEAQEQLDTQQIVNFMDQWFLSRPGETIEQMDEYSEFLSSRIDWPHPQDVETHEEILDNYTWSLATATAAVATQCLAVPQKQADAMSWFYPKFKQGAKEAAHMPIYPEGSGGKRSLLPKGEKSSLAHALEQCW